MLSSSSKAQAEPPTEAESKEESGAAAAVVVVQPSTPSSSSQHVNSFETRSRHPNHNDFLVSLHKIQMKIEKEDDGLMWLVEQSFQVDMESSKNLAEADKESSKNRAEADKESSKNRAEMLKNLQAVKQGENDELFKSYQMTVKAFAAVVPSTPQQHNNHNNPTKLSLTRLKYQLAMTTTRLASMELA